MVTAGTERERSADGRELHRTRLARWRLSPAQRLPSVGDIDDVPESVHRSSGEEGCEALYGTLFAAPSPRRALASRP